jgi:hypothetical protein
VERQVTPDGGMPSFAVDIAVRAHTSICRVECRA